MADGPSLGARLRALRRERGWTLKQLAGRTGLSVSYLSDLERGRSRPSLETLARLAEALGVPRAALLGEEPPAAGQPLTPQAAPPQAQGRSPGARSAEPLGDPTQPPPEQSPATVPPPSAPGERRFVASPPSPQWAGTDVLSFKRLPATPSPAPDGEEDWAFAVWCASEPPGGRPPPEVRILLTDPTFGPEIGPNWARLLAVLAAEVRQATGRPLSRRQLLEAYLFLRRVVGDLDRPRRRR